MTRRPILALAVLLSGLVLGVPTQHALAQTALEPATIRATELSPEQIQQIESYISQQFDRLAAAKPETIKTTLRSVRDQILAPLRDREISFRFRQEYSTRVLARLEQLPKDDELFLVNMLRICGELATQESTAVVERHLDSQSAAVRYAAIAALGRTFDAIAATSPAITVDRARALSQRLGQVVQKEPSGLVLDAAVRALLSAAAIERANFDVRSAAFRTLLQSMSERLKVAGGSAHDPETVVPAVRTGQAARDALAVAGPRALNNDESKLAGELAGHLTSYVVRRLKAGDFPAEDAAARDAAAQIMVVAETVVPLAGGKLGAAAPIRPGMGEDLKKGTSQGDQAFFSKAIELIGALQKPPFSFPVGHFLTEERAQRP
jgi:hypothetical protein